MTLPVAVILNRFVTDFLVLMPLGRRINFNSIAKERGMYIFICVVASAKFFKIGLPSRHDDFPAKRPYLRHYHTSQICAACRRDASASGRFGTNSCAT